MEDSRMQGGRKVDEASKVMGRRQAGGIEAAFTVRRARSH